MNIQRQISNSVVKQSKYCALKYDKLFKSSIKSQFVHVKVLKHIYSFNEVLQGIKIVIFGQFLNELFHPYFYEALRIKCP